MLPTSTSQMIRSKGFDELYSKYTVSKKKLGNGAFGSVYEGEDKITKKKVAIKRIRFSSDSILAKRLLREVSLLRMLKGHPNIISLEFIATSASDANHMFNEVALVFEYCPTDLHKVIQSSQQLTPQHIQYILYQILQGIYYIHSAKLVHRDLKPANILINEDCSIKICDLGLARANQIISDTHHSANGAPPPSFGQLTAYVITRWYRSPELIINSRAEAPADMWSIGCILAELLLRKPLFPGGNAREVLNLIMDLIGTPKQHDCGWITQEFMINYVTRYHSKSRETIQQKFVGLNESILDLLKNLLEFNPTKRIKAQQALQHPWFHKFFELRHLVPFSTRASSAAAQSSLNDYYEFEIKLDAQLPPSKPVIIQMASDLILREAERYTHKTASVPIGESKSDEAGKPAVNHNTKREQRHRMLSQSNAYGPGYFKPKKQRKAELEETQEISRPRWAS